MRAPAARRGARGSLPCRLWRWRVRQFFRTCRQVGSHRTNGLVAASDHLRVRPLLRRIPTTLRSHQRRHARARVLERKARVIVHEPAARAALLRGMTQMAALMRPTLGPVARTVAIAPIGSNGAPEILDNAAIIARRTLQLADPFENIGAMIIRHLALRVYEQAGDGSATAAVLATALMRAAVRCLAAGY